MVITVTLNPAMDKTMSVDDFSLGKVNRVSGIRYDIGGKGINVSKVLINFGVESSCMGFMGGIWENNIKDEIEKRKIDYRFTHIEGNTRTNTKIVDKVNNTFTDINEAGPEIEKETLEAFIDDFKKICSSDDIVVLSGGVSPSVPRDIYAVLTAAAKEKGATVILDADGELLKEGLKSKPDIIKPNEHELSVLFDIDGKDKKQLILAGKKLIGSGISKILISLGAEGAIYITNNGVLYAEGVKVPVKSTVGAGDSMVAALVYSLINKFTDTDTLKYAMSFGVSSVTLEGTQACSLKQVREYLGKIKITRL